jgi:hypothetical protein
VLHQDDREAHCGLARELGKHRSHYDGHWPGRPRYLCRRAAEQRREQAHANGPIEAGHRTGPRSHAESQRQGQRDDRRSQAAEQIVLQSRRAQAIEAKAI